MGRLDLSRRLFDPRTGPFGELSAKLNEYKEAVRRISASDSNVSALEGIRVKLTQGKGIVPLGKVCTINVLDCQKAEVSVLDPLFMKPAMSAIQGADKNFSVAALTDSKMLVSLPKATAGNRTALAEQIKRRTDAAKEEARDLRRRAINQFREGTKDKDEIHRFEQDMQREFDGVLRSMEQTYLAAVSQTKK